MNRPDWTVLEYDLVTTYYLRSLDDMQALTVDPQWVEQKKEAYVKSNMSSEQFVAGYEVVQSEKVELGLLSKKGL
jgi:hypothetical protein